MFDNLYLFFKLNKEFDVVYINIIVSRGYLVKIIDIIVKIYYIKVYLL